MIDYSKPVVLRDLSDRDVLDLYTQMVKVWHYDPGPRNEIYDLNVNQSDVANEILSRMKNSK